MELASFSLVKYGFSKFRYDMTACSNTSELEVSFSTACDFFSRTKEAHVGIRTSIREQGKESPFCELELMSVFKFSENVESSSIPEYFFRNSIAIVYPYIRTYISFATMQSNMNHVLLPTLNLSSLGEQLRNCLVVHD